MLAVVTLSALLGSLLAVVSPPAPAQAVATGTGGQFVPLPTNARIFDGATPAGSATTVPVAGVKGIPADGVGAISVLATVADANGTGQLKGRADSSDGPTLLMIYGSGVAGNTSNTSLLAVGDDGSIRIDTTTAQSRVILDVTGYYTSTANGVGAGGFVPLSGTRIANTADGTNVRQGALSGGDSITFQVTGKGGVPTNAAAVAVSVVVQNTGGGAGWVRPSPSDGPKSTGSLNYPSTKLTTAMTAQVAVGTDGKITIDNAPDGGTVQIQVDVQGYFVPSNPGGGFTPGTGRIVDTRTSSSVGANASVAVQVAGVAGIGTVEGGLSAVAVTVTAIHSGTTGGYAKAWADGSSEPTGAVIGYAPTSSIRTTTAILPVGSNGKVRIQNVSSGTTDFVLDLQGVYNWLPGGPVSTNVTGQRTSATTLPFPISDQTNASVDVGTGNLLVTTSALTLPGVTQSTTIGAACNSRSTTTANSNTMEANRWQYALAGAGDLSANAAGVVYTDAVGTAWQFKPTGTAGAFTSPPGLQMTLARVANADTREYTLTSWTTNQVIHFTLGGQPKSVNDRNGNQVSFNVAADKFSLGTLVSTAGTDGAKTAKVSYANGTTTFTQTSGSSSRSVSWAKNSNGDITTYTDATGATTTFGYTGGDLTSITAPTGGVTSFTYDSTKRVTKVSQANTTAGSPGTAVTRFAYTDGDTTQVADPRSDQAQPVATADHTTYTLDANDLVTDVKDAAGRDQSRTYKSTNNGVLSSTIGSGTGASTTNNKFDGNNGQSLTQSQSASGSTDTATYGTQAPTAYLPASTTDSSGNKTTYGYDGPGNQTSTGTGSGPDAAEAKLEYNKKDVDKYAWGAVKSATAPGNTVKTTYGYDQYNQLFTIDAPANTVGRQKYAYDDFGRVNKHTDGGGGVTSYTYDNDDRLLTTTFADSALTVTNTYDGNGNQLTQQSATGTITSTFDQRNRLISTVNTAGGGTVSYGYDLAGNTVRVTDQHGDVTHDYDPSNVLTATTYPTDAGTAKQIYLTDDHGRRTDTWLGASSAATPGVKPASWQGHQHIDYDSSGKVTRVRAWTGDNDATPVVNTLYCYIAGAATSGDCAADKANDRDKLQWSRNDLPGGGQKTTSYTYDSNGRLTKAAQAGGATNTTWAYTYDAAGNRLTAKQTGDATSSQTLTYNAVGQITSAGYAYDGVGNLVAAPGETFTYNDAQQLTASTKNGVTTRYEYAGADMNKLLTQSTDGGAEYDYTYGTTDQHGVPVITSRTVAGTGTASVISDPTTGQPMDLQTTDGVTSMWVIDGIGNPAAAIADTGNTAYTVSYDPYGAEAVNGGSSAQWLQNPYGFKAGLRSSSTDNGLTKFGYRWQTTATGGWIERDTLDAPLSPTNANRYAYAGNEPTNLYDATGRAGIPLSNCQTQAINVVAGGLATTATAIGTVAATASGVGIPVSAGGAIATGAAATATWTGYNTFLNECLD
ncbi:RHS repeat-associated core domain-containing protein [Curtobacterium sp. A7_M15]|uniref:RHS repeat-associated core domain-containing protein n=1 Tax=Curtobacterium sp. A7_M15 TaxID=3065241 RepID=UPI0027379999|nr:RHS repeat-associated core domain-containing protein [Curtobacterium sp. A7_M15]MDP4333131.1 RHS repeat-associated core domain-containing protein [Curtobacterium sp. A7_M15]